MEITHESIFPRQKQDALSLTIRNFLKQLPFRTAERIREVIWWPTIDRDVKNHVDKCPSCGACPHNSTTPGKAMHGIQPKGRLCAGTALGYRGPWSRSWDGPSTAVPGKSTAVPKNKVPGGTFPVLSVLSVLPYFY